MLNLFRRHMARCPHTRRSEKKCTCPVWVQGTLHGQWMKKSLGVRSWDAAQKIVRDWEAGSVPSATVKEACDAFTKDCEARNLSAGSVGKYKLLTDELERQFGERLVSWIAVQDLRDLRESWDLSPISARKKLERLKTFFRFCQESGWISANPAKPLKAPTAKPSPTLPFSDADMEKILWATEVYPDRPKGRRKQVRAFVLVLRYTGLRIGDAVNLRRKDIHDGKLLLRTEKTGTHVWLPLKDEVVESLSDSPPGTDYFFWNGEGTLRSGVSVWQRSLATLFELAGVEGHAHMFRDTFATSLLSAGVSLENVSKLLGHSSVRITERHYAPWVQSRQDALAAEVEKAWKLTS
jgi:integrase/recombinase XerD